MAIHQLQHFALSDDVGRSALDLITRCDVQGRHSSERTRVHEIPTSTLAWLPKTSLAVSRPRRIDDPSTTSSMQQKLRCG